MSIWLWVGLGGALGASGRYAITTLVSAQSFASDASFPWPTLAVNVVGSCLIGFTIALVGQSSWFNEFGRAFLVTGVLGGFTTFSAFSLEVVQLIQAGYSGIAFAYILASVIVCVAGAFAGLLIGSWL